MTREARSRRRDSPRAQWSWLAGEQVGYIARPWTTRTRVGVGLAVLAAANYGARRRDRLGTALQSGAMIAFALAACSRSFKDLIDRFTHSVITIHRSVTVSAPVHEVFAFWANPENYPKFMSYVHEVSQSDEGVQEWTLAGPGKVPLRWHALVGARLPDQLVSWRSVPEAPVFHAGQALIWENPNGTTCVEVDLTYAPPAGAAGWVLGHLLGFDPRKRIDEDLVLMKRIIEREYWTRQVREGKVA